MGRRRNRADEFYQELLWQFEAAFWAVGALVGLLASGLFKSICFPQLARLRFQHGGTDSQNAALRSLSIHPRGLRP